jgi:hypothetical protein
MTRRPALARALKLADFLHDQCSPRAAATLLHLALEPYDPATTCSDWLVIKAATVYAAAAFDNPAEQLAYALFAERNSRTELGLADPLTVSAMTILVAVTRAQDLPVDAITVCGRLIDAHTGRREPANALTWRRERAILRHHDGQCEQAHDEIAHCLALSGRLTTGAERQRAARHALIHQTVILAACGDTRAAVALLRRHHTVLPPVDSTERRADEATVAGQIHALARTHPSVCERAGTAHAAEQLPDEFWTIAVRTAGQR